jgi:uncharacterized protein HemX
LIVRRVLALVAALACVVVLALPAAAQEPTSSSTTVGLQSQDIIPAPNSGSAPQDAGDRGGALQLGLLALVAAAIGCTVLVLVRQSRRAQA